VINDVEAQLSAEQRAAIQALETQSLAQV